MLCPVTSLPSLGSASPIPPTLCSARIAFGAISLHFTRPVRLIRCAMSMPGTHWLRVSFEPPDVVSAPDKPELVGPGGSHCWARLHATGMLRSSTSTGAFVGSSGPVAKAGSCLWAVLSWKARSRMLHAQRPHRSTWLMTPQLLQRLKASLSQQSSRATKPTATNLEVRLYNRDLVTNSEFLAELNAGLAGAMDHLLGIFVGLLVRQWRPALATCMQLS
eukprot:scaffold126320_cov33-Prasinocladus_malaysianus.AAC.1